MTILLATVLAACASIREPENVAITEVNESEGYRRLALTRQADIGDSLIMLAFSGGGTRAAALSYGVMQELRDTTIELGADRRRILHEVDSISSVSGGSFTAAYYGLYRDRLFTDYESDFLRRDVQSNLLKGLLNPANWFRGVFSGFDRTEMAITYYDQHIFRGATFNDILSNGPPYIDINATDLTTGLRFTFSQELFDLICTDLGSFSVARAVTASSAVPVAFPPVVLKNHARECDISETVEWSALEGAQPTSVTEEQLVEGLKSYRNADNRQYIHLVDGGISDNLGLRSMIDRVQGLGEGRLASRQGNLPKNVLIILVNAETRKARMIESTAKKPSPAITMSAYISSQMSRYNQETLDAMRRTVDTIATNSRERGTPVDVHFAEVSFNDIQAKEVSAFFNRTPTTLELGDVEIDRLIAAGRMLLRNDPEYQAFIQSRNGRLSDTAPTKNDLCRLFNESGCVD
jgi:NTE family protein